MEKDKIPLGFGMALAQNGAAMSFYGSLDPVQRQEILDKAYQMQSKEEMQQLVDSMGREWIFD